MPGMVRPGEARQGYHRHYVPGEARHGDAGLGKAGLCVVRRGEARQGILI